MKTRILAVISLCLVIFCSTVGLGKEVKGKKIDLSVLFYPFVPNYEQIVSIIKKEFEKQHPNINLLRSKQNWNYYDDGGLDAKFDIYELDTVFLADFVLSDRIQVIDPGKLRARQDTLEFAENASHWNGLRYGIPHWTCALFLFYFDHDGKVKGAQDAKALEAAIGVPHERGRGLLIDMGGHYTLGELYVDCLIDQGLSLAEILTSLNTGELYQPAIDAMTRILFLSDVGLARSDLAHDAWPPYFTHEFAHGRGRALVGYSERLYYILSEIKSPTDPTPVVDPQRIRAKLFNQGASTARSLAWVDCFVIDKSLNGRRLDAAYNFLQFVTSDEAYLLALLPPESPPQYLLPAYKMVFTIPELVRQAPLYSDFLTSLNGVQSFSAPSLGNTLRRVGDKVNKTLPKHLIGSN